MIRGFYAKVFLWFWFSALITWVAVALFTVAIHSQSLGPRWMVGVLDLYARSAVDLYRHGGKPALSQYLADIERSSHIRATLLDPRMHDVAGRGVPSGDAGVLELAESTGHSQFSTALEWRGASVIDGPDGKYILVAEVNPYVGLMNWKEARTPLLRSGFALLCAGLLCMLLARHITTPIRALQSAARRIADGDLSVRAVPSIGARNDELAELARDFDRMAERVQGLLIRQQELLADISHELRSPLARLNVCLELVRRGNDGAAERMQADLNHVDVLIGQILTLTRLESVGPAKAVTMVNLRAVVEGVAENAQFEGLAERKCVQVTHADNCWIQGDPDLLRSLIENVVRNSVHYTEPQTSVTIALNLVESDNSREARIIIGDHGPGVPRDSLPRLFEPFYRVSASRERKTGGSGLGLSIAQRIAALHGGSIAARNRETGGLEMEIRLLSCVDAAPATLESQSA